MALLRVSTEWYGYSTGVSRLSGEVAGTPKKERLVGVHGDENAAARCYAEYARAAIARSRICGRRSDSLAFREGEMRDSR